MTVTKTKARRTKRLPREGVVRSSPVWTPDKQALLDKSVAANEGALRRLAKL